MTAILDILENTSISEDKDGYRVDRQAIVHSVTGTASERIYNALTDAGLPSIGDAHPNIATITLQNRSAEVIDNETVRVTLSYYNDPGSLTGIANASVRASSNTVIEESKYDYNEEALKTQYVWSGGTVNVDPFTAEVERSRIIYDFQYITADFPLAEINTYSNSLNLTEWNGYGPGQVYCSTVNVDQSGDDYTVNFTFIVDYDGWSFKARVSYPDLPLTAHPTNPDSLLDLTTGERFFDVIKSVEFSHLNITIPGIRAGLSGTITASTIETDIKTTGGKTIILPLTNDTWVTAGATFDAARQDIIDNLVSNKSETNGWNSLTIPVTDVVRTSDTIVTITLSAQASYDITKAEKIRILIPETALTTSTVPVTVSQTFTIDPV